MHAKPKPDCWRGVGDPAPYVPGVPETVPRARSLPALFSAMACCTRCELALGRTQVVVGAGDPAARLMFVGEAPGKQEDLQGHPFVGQAGKLFDRLLSGIGLTREEVFVTNVVACRPPGNRTPKASEIKAHAPWLEHQLALVRPALLVTLGRVALTYFLPRARVTEVRGQPQEVERDGRVMPLLPLLHPASVFRDYHARLPVMEADFGRIPGVLAEAEE